MEKSNYWANFWQTNSIINKVTAHEKVGRTINGVPIEDERWQRVLDDLGKRLSLSPDDELLDIGAGSGVISIPFSKKTKKVTAVDVSETLLSEMHDIANITTIYADAREIEFHSGSFDKIIIYFAIQHFTEEETILLMKKVFNWLKPNGILYIGDIPDSERKFVFFNTPERQKAYFNSVVTNTPIIGTWFQKDFFSSLSQYIGFSFVEIIDQPADFINSHYRFDAKLIK